MISDYLPALIDHCFEYVWGCRFFLRSDEFGDHRGHSIFKGRVCAIPKVNDLPYPIVYHILWNKRRCQRSWERTILNHYYVHSEMYFGILFC